MVVTRTKSTFLSLMGMGIVAAGMMGLATNVQADELIHHWTLDGNVLDNIGGADGTVVGTECYGPGARDCLDQSFCFDGATYISTPLELQVGTDESLTISTWATMPTEPPQNHMDICGLERTDAQEIRLSLNTAGNLIASFRDDSHDPNLVVVSAPLDGNWHHFAAIRNKTNDKIELYIDGVLAGNDDDTGGDINFGGPMMLDIGADNNSTFGHQFLFLGSIDDVRIYDYALSADEVMQLANPCPDLELFEPLPGIAGGPNSFQVTSCTFGEDVTLMYSLKEGLYDVPGCGGVHLSLEAPKKVDTAIANFYQEAWITVSVPSQAAGMTVYFQAYEPDTCRFSNLMIFTF